MLTRLCRRWIKSRESSWAVKYCEMVWRKIAARKESRKVDKTGVGWGERCISWENQSYTKCWHETIDTDLYFLVKKK